MFRLLFFVIFSVFFIACKEEPAEKPNVLWITCEDISPAWGCYGDELATTPHIDRLAAEGHIFTQAFSNAPICAPARSTLITGMYATSLGTQNLRSEIPVPADLKILPELLKEAGYFTTNNAKTDYNFSAEGRWDENSNTAHWRNRATNQPFFSVFNFGITHEGHANSDRPEDTQTLDVKHDPAEMKLPPYFPDTDEFRSIMAHQYDLITVFDQEVGKLVDQLKEDGLYDNTIIFIFSDHGFGLPRYKRWLYNTGLQVPFVLHVPEQYREHVDLQASSMVDRKVGFVDFAPTVLSLVGLDAPAIMEGETFLGTDATAKEYIFGYRDRADDAYDMSRAVYDGRFLYIRNFMPHVPYIQNAIIFNKGKRSYEELFRVKSLGDLNEEQMELFLPKDIEELYDLATDPHELNNIIDDPELEETGRVLRNVLMDHLRKTRDSGLLNEGDMMERANQNAASVYQLMHDESLIDVGPILEAANAVGAVHDLNDLNANLNAEEAAMRWWSLQAADAYEGDIAPLKSQLITMLGDPSVPNKAKAAELLINRFDYSEAYDVLKESLVNSEDAVLLQVAISVRKLGEKAKPLVPFIQEEVYPSIEGNVWGRYKSWSYPMFIGMALDQTLINCGIEVAISN